MTTFSPHACAHYVFAHCSCPSRCTWTYAFAQNRPHLCEIQRMRGSLRRVRVIRVVVLVVWLTLVLSLLPKTLAFPRSRTLSRHSSVTKTTCASWKQTLTYVFHRYRLFWSHAFVWHTAHAWFYQASARVWIHISEKKTRGFVWFHTTACGL